MFFSSQSSENHWQWLQFPLQWVEDKPEHLKGKMHPGVFRATQPTFGLIPERLQECHAFFRTTLNSGIQHEDNAV